MGEKVNLVNWYWWKAGLSENPDSLSLNRSSKLKLGLYAQNIENDSFANNFSKFFDLTNESDQSYYTGGLGALRSKENVCGVCLGTPTGSNGCSSELRICPVSYMYIKYLNVLSD